MNHLISVRSNLLFSKDGENLRKFRELVFLVDKPMYKQINSGEIVRERAIDEVRLVVSDKGFDELITLLQKMKDADEIKPKDSNQEPADEPSNDKG